MRVSNPLYRVYHKNLGNFLLKRLCIFRVEEGDCGLLEKMNKCLPFSQSLLTTLEQKLIQVQRDRVLGRND